MFSTRCRYFLIFQLREYIFRYIVSRKGEKYREREREKTQIKINERNVPLGASPDFDWSSLRMTVSLLFSEKFDKIVTRRACNTAMKCASRSTESLSRTHGISFQSGSWSEATDCCSKSGRTCDEPCLHDGTRDCNTNVWAWRRTARHFYLLEYESFVQL